MLRRTDNHVVQQADLHDLSPPPESSGQAAVGVARGRIARGVVVHEDVRIGTGQNRRAVYLAGMGNRFVQTAHADDVITDHTQLGVEERRHEMLLVRFMAGVVRDNLPPQTIGRLRRIHRIAGRPRIGERGFAHAVQNDSERKVSLRKGIAHAIFFQKRNGESWSAPDARCCQGRSRSEVENGINGGTRRGETVYAGFPESLDSGVREADRDESPAGRRARGEGWISRARSSRRKSAALPLMRMPDGGEF